jgi:hypothetical protein
MRLRLGRLWAMLGACGAACGEEFPNEPSKSVTLQPAGWPGAVFVTTPTIDVSASLRAGTRSPGSGRPGSRVTTRS